MGRQKFGSNGKHANFVPKEMPEGSPAPQGHVPERRLRQATFIRSPRDESGIATIRKIPRTEVRSISSLPFA
jgi:hypothetical protein